MEPLRFFDLLTFRDYSTLNRVRVELKPEVAPRNDMLEKLLSIANACFEVSFNVLFNIAPAVGLLQILRELEDVTGEKWCYVAENGDGELLPVLFHPYKLDGVVRFFESRRVFPIMLANFLARYGEWRKHKGVLGPVEAALLEACSVWDFTRLPNVPVYKALEALLAVYPHPFPLPLLEDFELLPLKWKVAVLLYNRGRPGRVTNVRKRWVFEGDDIFVVFNSDELVLVDWNGSRTFSFKDYVEARMKNPKLKPMKRKYTDDKIVVYEPPPSRSGKRGKELILVKGDPTFLASFDSTGNIYRVTQLYSSEKHSIKAESIADPALMREALPKKIAPINCLKAIELYSD